MTKLKLASDLATKGTIKGNLNYNVDRPRLRCYLHYVHNNVSFFGYKFKVHRILILRLPLGFQSEANFSSC